MPPGAPTDFQRRVRAVAAACLCAIAVASCSEPTAAPPMLTDPNAIKADFDAFTAAQARGSDAGSDGEKIATDYALKAFRAGNLKTSVQSIPFVKMTPMSTSLSVNGSNWKRTPTFGSSYVAWTRQPKEKLSIDAPIVFAGFGIVAPEFKWNDFKDVDVTGKVIIVLDDAPRNGGHEEFGTLGETYYGRRAYKFEEAARHGAAGVFIIHEDSPTRPPWSALLNSLTGAMLAIDSTVSDVPPMAQVEGWLTSDGAADIFRAAGLDLTKLKANAHETNFRPVEVMANAQIDIVSAVERVAGSNVIGTVEGQTPEYVVVSSRWNHVSVTGLPGDTTKYRDSDEAPGAAILLEVAKVFAKREKPRRSVIFLVTTAHRAGLLGLRYFTTHSPVPPNTTRANVFFDSADPHDEGKHLRTIGPALHGLTALVNVIGARQGRVMEIEHDPDRLFYYRLSQEAFASAGIPEIYLTTASSTPATSAAGTAARAEDLPFNPAGALRDVELLFKIATVVEEATNWPKFRKPGEAKPPRGPAAGTAPSRETPMRGIPVVPSRTPSTSPPR